MINKMRSRYLSIKLWVKSNEQISTWTIY
jgi:hypothetical protein